MEGCLWITWEDHRRSKELARALGVPLLVQLSRRPYLLRVIVLGWRAARELARRRPRCLIVQNPSIVLTLLAVLLKKPLGYRLVVDRHSNFEILSLQVPRVVEWIFPPLSRFTLRGADLTLVTNPHHLAMVERAGGSGFILPDKLPELSQGPPAALPPGHHAVFVCSFSSDEPVREVLAAAALLPADVTVHITGNQLRADPVLLGEAPHNACFTGYLAESDYLGLLRAADVVLALTANPNTLLCCAYEATALGKPMVLSAHEALTTYFHAGAVAANNSPHELAGAIKQALDRREELSAQVRELARELDEAWRADFARLLARMRQIGCV